MKKLHTKQFTVTGKQNLGVKVQNFIQANEIELNDISQLNFSADHSSAMLVFLSDKKKFTNEPQEETE